MSIAHNEMSIGHTEMSVRPSVQQKCPLDIQMSIRPLDEQKCPVDIEMSIRPMDRWTNGHCLMANTLVSYPPRVMLNHITSFRGGSRVRPISRLTDVFFAKK